MLVSDYLSFSIFCGPILEARAEILKKISLFPGKFKVRKFLSEIT